MNKGLKLLIYAVLLAVCGVSGYFTLRDFNTLLNRDRTRSLPSAEATSPASQPTVDPQPIIANASPLSVADPNSGASSNLLDTPGVASSGTFFQTNAPSNQPPAGDSTNQTPVAAQTKGRSTHLGVSMGVFLLSLAILGLFGAKDFSNFMGERALDILYNEDRAGVKDPEYDEAEEIWARGEHLDAIRHLREYLKRNPREIHAAIRIAEIYEKDLGNNLAAALEYEEILRCKLTPDRWGWTAIHLCNLYFRLQQEAKALVLLQRIILEHGETPAAEKARKRLEQMGMAPPQPPSTSDIAEDEETTGSNLPSGFKPKKRW